MFLNQFLSYSCATTTLGCSNTLQWIFHLVFALFQFMDTWLKVLQSTYIFNKSENFTLVMEFLLSLLQKFPSLFLNLLVSIQLFLLSYLFRHFLFCIPHCDFQGQVGFYSQFLTLSSSLQQFCIKQLLNFVYEFQPKFIIDRQHME